MKMKHKVIISGVIVLVLTAASIFSLAAEKLPQYRKIIVTSARKTTMGQTLKLKGYIEPKAKQEILLDTDQKVAEVLVKEGQEVRAGDLLLRLDDTDTVYKMKSEELNLKSAQIDLNALLKSENKDKKDLAYAVTQAEIQYKNAEEDYTDSKTTYEDNQKLYSEGFISKEELDSAARRLSKSEGEVKLQKMKLEQAQEALNGFEDSRQNQVNKLRSSMELIKLNMESLNAKVDLNTKALINGKVIRCKVENGQYPSPDNAKIEIADLSQYVISAYIKQNEAVQLTKGQKASIVITGLEQKTYIGTVIDIDENASLPEDGSNLPKVRIKVAVDEPDQNVKIGFETEVKIDLNIKTDVLAVDFQGIVEDNKGNTFVYLLKDNKAVRKMVKTGMEDGFMVEIVEGLISGDQYILNPPERVQDEPSFKLWSWGYEVK